MADKQVALGYTSYYKSDVKANISCNYVDLLIENIEI